jgi:hypothetical protein
MARSAFSLSDEYIIAGNRPGVGVTHRAAMPAALISPARSPGLLPAPNGARGRDVAIRVSGSALIALCAASMHLLSLLIRGGPPHDATPLELVLAIGGFAGGSIGICLLFLGRHVHDRVRLSSRWRPAGFGDVSRRRPSGDSRPPVR